jgi:hypothetical protein
MDIFDKLVEQLLNEFNVEDRNDPAFYDYAVIFVQQLKARNLVPPGVDVRKTAMQIVKDQYYNYIDINDNVSFKVSFFFDNNEPTPNNLRVEIDNLLNDDPPKMVENTHEEESIDEIVDFLDTASREAERANSEVPGQDVPAEVGETPSEMPDAKSAQQVPNTSQYLKGL